MINRSRIRITILASAIAVCSLDLARADPFLTSPFPAPVVSTQTWKDLRDDGVVKQSKTWTTPVEQRHWRRF